MEDSYERFEDLYSDFHENFIDEDKYLTNITQNLTPDVQVIFVYCFRDNDLLTQFFVSESKKENFESDANIIYWFFSRNDEQFKKFLQFGKEYFS